jgi:hypothetical protein
VYFFEKFYVDGEEIIMRRSGFIFFVDGEEEFLMRRSGFIFFCPINNFLKNFKVQS